MSDIHQKNLRLIYWTIKKPIMPAKAGIKIQSVIKKSRYAQAKHYYHIKFNL